MVAWKNLTVTLFIVKANPKASRKVSLTHNIRRHRERKQAYAARQKPPIRRDHAELNARWQDKRPNSIN